MAQEWDGQLISRIVLRDGDKIVTQRLARIRGKLRYGSHTFPSPAQYREAVAQINRELKDQDEERLIAHAQRDWHVRGQTGCNFARIAAARSETLVWSFTVVRPSAVDVRQELAIGIGQHMEAAVRDPAVALHSVLMAGIDAADQIVTAVRCLTKETRFWLERDEVSSSLLRLNLRYPLGDSGPQAWVMAFGPFDFMPNTRKAPYFELATRVKPKPPNMFHRLNQDARVAHLADVSLGMHEPRQERVFAYTLRRTREILGGEPDDVSAAKATLAIPTAHLR